MYLLVVLVLFLGVIAQNEAEDKDFVPSLLLESARNDDVLGIRKAIADGVNIDVTNVNGWSGALFAVANGRLSALHALIDAGIDLNQANIEGRTPLMFAAQQGDKEMVEVLLTNNADPSIVTPENLSAYEIALESKRQLVALQIAESCVLRQVRAQSPQMRQITFVPRLHAIAVRVQRCAAVGGSRCGAPLLGSGLP